MRNYTKNAARQLLEALSPQLTQLGKNVTPGLQASKDTQRFCERYSACIYDLAEPYLISFRQ